MNKMNPPPDQNTHKVAMTSLGVHFEYIVHYVSLPRIVDKTTAMVHDAAADTRLCRRYCDVIFVIVLCQITGIAKHV